jgi:hypothetical protein
MTHQAALSGRDFETLEKIERGKGWRSVDGAVENR